MEEKTLKLSNAEVRMLTVALREYQESIKSHPHYNGQTEHLRKARLLQDRIDVIGTYQGAFL